MLTLPKKNLIANFAGSIWVGLVSFIFIPLYLKYLGAEGYGLIGFQATLLGILVILDLGFGSAGSREIAKLKSEGQSSESINNLFVSLEILFWGIATAIGVALFLLSDVIYSYWLKVSETPQAVALKSIQLICLTLVLQLPVSLYTGCLNGLQRQVTLNSINVVLTTLRFGGAAFVAWFWGGNLIYFFLWQLLVAGLNLLFLRWAVKQNLPKSNNTSFSFLEIKKVSKFAIGVSAINLFSLILTQMDKILLSKILSLKDFGYYMLAWSVAGVIYRISVPVFNAVYPRLVELSVNGQDDDLNTFYQKSTQLMALLTIPFSLFLSFFAFEIIALWTQDPEVSEKVYLSVVLLALGTLFSALMQLPYGLQLAKGWTQLSLNSNLIATFVLVPVLLFSTKALNMPALAWLLLNLGYLVFVIRIMHSRILVGKAIEWYKSSLLAPIAISTAMLFFFKRLYSFFPSSGVPLQIFLLSLFGIMTFGVVAFFTPASKQELKNLLLKSNPRKV